MLLQSSAGQMGDRISLLTPQKSFDRHTTLTFHYNIRLNSLDTVGALDVYTSTKLQLHKQNLFRVSGDQGKQWRVAVICLPVGTYSLAFVGTIGMKYLSDIAIDSVSLSTDGVCTPGKTPSYRSPGKTLLLLFLLI
jgi:hypothetical protein